MVTEFRSETWHEDKKGHTFINWNWVEQTMGAIHARVEYYSVIHCTHETNPTISVHLNNTAQLITPSSSLSAVTTTPMAPVRTGRLMGT